MTSVVSSRPATDAAFCSARRVTQRLIEDALFQHVAVLAGARVVPIGALARLDGVQDNRGIFAGVDLRSHLRASQQSIRDPGSSALLMGVNTTADLVYAPCISADGPVIER